MMRLIRTPQIITAPAAWSDLPNGEIYQRALQQRFEPWIAKLFGFHLIKLGALSMAIDTGKCGITHQVNIASSGDNLQLQADYYQLPLVEKSIDACIMAHVLPYVAHPHHLLREVDRVLMDDGWLLLSSFNPYSALGIGKMIPGLRGRQPYSSQMLSEQRLLDWLVLLNYEVMQHGCFEVLPCNQPVNRLLETHFPAIGCLSFIVARKRTVPLTFDPLKHYKLQFGWRRKTPAAVKMPKTNLHK